MLQIPKTADTVPRGIAHPGSCFRLQAMPFDAAFGRVEDLLAKRRVNGSPLALDLKRGTLPIRGRSDDNRWIRAPHSVMRQWRTVADALQRTRVVQVYFAPAQL